jgi:hypothetical protein
MTDPQQKSIDKAHLAAIADGRATYIDPRTGFQVFTEVFLIERGYCCLSECRHCPYGHAPAPPNRRPT